jgi:hypothetical protein
MPRESNIPSITTLQDTDIIRAVTSAGESKNTTAANAKTYFTGTPPNYAQTIAVSQGQSIKDAIDAIVDASASKPYLVEVYPGIYTESNPIQGKSYITVKGVGGINTVTVKAGTPTQNLFEMVPDFYIQDMTIQDVSGASNYAINFTTGAGNVQLKNIIFENCSNAVNFNNVTAAMEIESCTLQNISTPATSGITVRAGNATIRNLSIVGSSTIGTVVNVTGVNSIATLYNVLSFSANVGIGIFIQDLARVVVDGSSFVGMTDGVVLEGGCNFRAVGDKIFNAQQDAFRVNNVGSSTRFSCQGCSFEDSTRYDVNILSATALGSGDAITSIANTNIISGAKVYGTITDLVEGDEGLNILGELHVGTPDNPAESVFGGGDSHTNMLVYSFDGASTYTNRTVAASSFSGSTFTFDGVTAGNAIYVANLYDQTFEGIKEIVETAAVIGSGEMVAEFWNGTAWEAFNGCTVLASPAYLKYAKNYFNQIGDYHVKFNPYIRDNWVKNDPVTLGTNYYWMRFRIATTITTAPVFQQFKIHTNRSEKNPDGTDEYHMDARVYKKLTVDAVRPVEGSMQNASVYVDENVGVGLENNRFTTAGDLLGISFELPEDCDTSAPLIFVWKGKFATAGTVDFTVRKKTVKPGDAYTNAEPAASGDVVTVTTGSVVIGAANIREDFRVDIDISDAIPSRAAGFGDEIWITLQYPTRGGGNFDYTKLSANYLSDFAGRHIRQ